MRDAERAVDADAYEPGPEIPRYSADEKELLLRHREGDPSAFPELVRAYKAPVYAFLCRSGVPDRDCEDVFQEVFIKIHQNARRFDEERELHPWVFTIVVNTTRSYLRRHGRRAVSMEQMPAESIDAEAPSAERELATKQAMDRLQAEIRALPERHREALLLAVVENLSMRDIATVLDVPVNTVKTWLRRARSRLLERFSKEIS